MDPVTLLIVGAGNRGETYAGFALEHPERARVIGVAEPRAARRDRMVARHGLEDPNVFTDWKDMASRERFADAVVIATQDAMHTGPALAFVRKGYAVLLEKPMAPTLDECERIATAAAEEGVMFSVCHVLRYTPYTQQLKKVIEAGAIGEVVSMQHFEPVGWWHQAHSYVRGNWGNTARSSSMLLAKSCHDIDWMVYIMGVPARRVSSFGNLYHFRPDKAPPGAGERCLDCPVEPDCPYSAKRIYLDQFRAGHTGWPVDVITDDLTEEGVIAALQYGPYGVCVYKCDNDVVDHQVVNMEFDTGRTASFVMTGFCKGGHRKTRIFGTHGQIEGDGETIEVFSFVTEKTEVIDVNSSDASILGGHGGGDYGVMDAFISAVANNEWSYNISGPTETIESHRATFAAERARLENRVIEIEPYMPWDNPLE